MRGRGGGGNNRKGPNPLTRNYESNGPDVKIRGSAQQIAEKYANLARDALGAGDRIMAENYLQHAEHYNRIIMAAQAQFAQQQPMRDNRDDFEEESEEEREEFEQAPASTPAPVAAETPKAPITGAEPQPVIEGMPAEVALEQETLGRERRANGNGGEQEEGAAPRRSRRPRRNRNRGEQQGAGEAGESAAESGEQEIVVPAAAES